MAKHPAPWTVIIDGAGAQVIDAERQTVLALSHHDQDHIALWHRIVDAVNRQAKVKELTDLYFAPWGSAKSEQWESLTGDAPFDPESALRVIQSWLR